MDWIPTDQFWMSQAVDGMRAINHRAELHQDPYMRTPRYA
jgi:hypothetical protein